MTDLVRHHIKYKEIHGVDEVVLMTRSEHFKLHRRLRDTGKCTIPSDDLCKISIAAAKRDILNCGGANREKLPSIETVIDVLNNIYFITSREIADIINYPKRAVDSVLNYMYENGIIERKIIIRDKHNFLIYGLDLENLDCGIFNENPVKVVDDIKPETTTKQIITTVELRIGGRLVINQATRDAGNMKEGDILQLKIEIMKKKNEIR